MKRRGKGGELGRRDVEERREGVCVPRLISTGPEIDKKDDQPRSKPIEKVEQDY